MPRTTVGTYDFFGIRRRALPIAYARRRVTFLVAVFGLTAAVLGIVMAGRDLVAALDLMVRYDTRVSGDTLGIFLDLGYIGFMVYCAVISVAMLAAARDAGRAHPPKTWPGN